MLKAALKLKDALVLRCSGMALQHGGDEKGPWLKITYYDEDGADVSERFRLQTPPSAPPSNNCLFARIPAPRGAAALDNAGGYRDPAGAAAPSGLCRRPHEGQYWQVREKCSIIRGVFVAPTSCVN